MSRYLDSQLLLLESFVPDEYYNHSPHGSQYGIVKSRLRGSTVLYVLTVFVLLGLCTFGHVFDWQILMDKYLGLGLDNGMADLVCTVLPDIALFGVALTDLLFCYLSPIGLFLLLGQPLL